MKKNKYNVFITSCLALFLLLSLLFAPPITAATSQEQEISPLGTCSNHNFVFGGYHEANKQHTLVCANEGCTAYLVEECYFHGFCGDYPDQTTIGCEGCGYGTFILHDYYANYYYYMIDGYHTWVCQNTDEYGSQCFSVSDTEECTLDAIKIWRGYSTGEGHYMTSECLVCYYTYDEGCINPDGHPEEFSETNDCELCQLDYPYWIYAHNFFNY